MSNSTTTGNGTLTDDIATMRSITADELRALAELADSRRGRTILVVRNPDGQKDAYSVVDEGKRSSDDRRPVVMKLRTEHRDPRPVDRADNLQISSTPALKIKGRDAKAFDNVDAIFTSIVAIEKFVLPYYARFRPPEEVQKIRNEFASDANALAVIHTPDSEPAPATIDGTFDPTGVLVLTLEDAASKTVTAQSLLHFGLKLT